MLGQLKNPTNPPLKIFGTEDSAGENQSHSMVHRRQVRIVDKGSNRARGPRGCGVALDRSHQRDFGDDSVHIPTLFGMARETSKS